jgi:acyl-CoA thioester hydrolase
MERVATVRVLFADTDAMGIVYYANYLKWFVSPARYDDLLAVHAEVRGCKRASIAFGYRIEREDGSLLADGATVHAFTDGDGKIIRVPDSFLEKTGLKGKISSKEENRGTKPGA